MQGPDKGSGKAAGQRHSCGQRRLASLLGPIPHPLPFPGLDPPFYLRVWQMEVSRIPPLQTPQPHPLTLLLKEPEERREVAAQEHHHDCRRHRSYPDLSKTPGDAFTTNQWYEMLVHRPTAELQSVAPSRGGGGAALQVLLPPSLVPPLYRPRPASGAQGQEPSDSEKEIEARSVWVLGSGGQYD